MKGKEIRKKFLEYFQRHNHQIVKSSSLIPKNDPTLLFTNAGMNQFKDVFLGIEKRDYKRAASAQKCVRAGGKHNDLENVGYTARHHTFFEMLGNFSFGDYFKESAIFYGWDFLTREMNLPKERLWVTIYEDDDEAFELWQKVAGISPDRIVRLGEKDNFWAMGDEGPCGPCSEILIDQGEDVGCKRPDCKVGCDCDRFLELWNLVFMQYNRKKDGTLEPLPNPSIDTGMGLERISAVLQGVKSNFETDLLYPYIDMVASMVGVPYGKNEKNDIHYRVIADHIRAITFLISDGVIPSNEGRGYVLRRIIRRAVRHAKMLGFSKPVLFEIAPLVVDVMKDEYIELVDNIELVKKILLNEEEKFLETLDSGLKILFENVENLKKLRSKILPGDVAFKLYDTYGFPLDLTEDVLREYGMAVDIEGFEEYMAKQREIARKSWKGEEEAINELYKRLAQELKVDFKGYETLRCESRLLKIIKNGELVDFLEKDELGDLIFDITPFYGESGGQVGDKGVIEGDNFVIDVLDTKKIGELIVHKGKVRLGKINIGDQAILMVDEKLRDNTAAHHTSTHLLQSALQRVLGNHVKQAGSLVEPERLRFDFTHFGPLKEEEIREVEYLVNKWIRDNRVVIIKNLSYETAIKTGAMAIFGEKYGEIVRVVEVDGVSKEFCGGTHQTSTGKIGFFKILSEESVASGVRRIEAVAGESAYRWVQDIYMKLNRFSAIMKTPLNDLEDRIQKIIKREKELEKELEAYKNKITSLQAKDFIKVRLNKEGVKVIASEIPASDINQLRNMLDTIKEREKSSLIFLISNIDDKIVCLAYVSEDLFDRYDASNLLKNVVSSFGGRGGGKKNLAQGAIPAGKNLSEVLDKIYEVLGL